MPTVHRPTSSSQLVVSDFSLFVTEKNQEESKPETTSKLINLVISLISI
jgi:hypothetical protein